GPRRRCKRASSVPAAVAVETTCPAGRVVRRVCFFFRGADTTFIYTLSLHDALPICPRLHGPLGGRLEGLVRRVHGRAVGAVAPGDRKSTRLNSSHVKISYAVFCLKKKSW